MTRSRAQTGTMVVGIDGSVKVASAGVDQGDRVDRLSRHTEQSLSLPLYLSISLFSPLSTSLSLALRTGIMRAAGLDQQQPDRMSTTDCLNSTAPYTGQRPIRSIARVLLVSVQPRAESRARDRCRRATSWHGGPIGQLDDSSKAPGPREVSISDGGRGWGQLNRKPAASARDHGNPDFQPGLFG